MDEANEYLGVETSFSELGDGFVLMDVTPKRRARLRELVEQVEQSLHTYAAYPTLAPLGTPDGS